MARAGVDPLFVGLTRPSLIFGVSMELAMVNMMVCIMYFIQTSSIKIIFIAAVIHMVGYVACLKEPRFMKLYMLKMGKFNDCSNRAYYGANSYDV